MKLASCKSHDFLPEAWLGCDWSVRVEQVNTAKLSLQLALVLADAAARKPETPAGCVASCKEFVAAERNCGHVTDHKELTQERVRR